MTDLELLFLVLGIIYCWECSCWAGQGLVGFRSWLGKSWSPVKPSRVLGTQRAGMIAAVPLPPLGTLFLSQSLPFSISSTGVTAGGAVASSNAAFLPFAEINKIEARASSLLLNSKPFVKASSPHSATYLAGFLEKVRSAKPDERNQILERELGHAFQTKAIERRWEEFKTETQGLRISANFLFIFLFLLAPLTLWRIGLVLAWPWLLAGLVVSTSTIAFQYYQAHKKLYPKAEDERFTQCIILVLSPASAVRALDVLSRPVLDKFHPLAITKVFCSKTQFRTLAAEFLRDLTYPIGQRPAQVDSAAQSTEESARRLSKTLTETFLRGAGLKPDELLQPPPPNDPTSQLYCPRCLAQFTSGSRLCSDCGDVALIPFEPTLAKRHEPDRG